MLHGRIAPELSRAVAAGLRYIGSAQLPGGGFLSYSTTDPQDFTAAIPYRTTFFPSLILTALSGSRITGSQAIRRRLMDFLLAQRSETWSFNYWDRLSPTAKSQPYPDDLDDTMTALIALFKTDPKLFDGKLNAHVAKLLIASEVAPGGPYRTWLVDEQAGKQWQDVDLAVNTNVARFLKLQLVQLPNIEKFMERAISTNKLQSPYYPSAYPLIYFMSQGYEGSYSPKLVDWLLRQRQQDSWQNPLQTALAITSLCHLGHRREDLETAAAYLLKAQAADGSWPAATFCIDPTQNGRTAYAGAAALTTAFCMEALQLWQQTSPVKPAKVQSVTDRRYSAVTKQVRAVLHSLENSELKSASQKALRRLLRQDTDRQIVLLPWLIADVLQRPVDEAVLNQLAAGSLWGWMAYTLYDDFLDDESEAVYLLVANLCLRQLVVTLQASLDNTEFQALCWSILDCQEGANAWEVTHCRAQLKDGKLYAKRLPDYGDYAQLADRSFGHAIAAFGVLVAAGITLSSSTARHVQTFFRHYLIARQLDDDAHDWEEDLQAGRLNAVTTLVLAEYERQHKRSLQAGVDLAAAADDLRLIMWQLVIPQVCAQIMQHAQEARAALKAARLPQTRKLAALLTTHEQSARQALQHRTEALEFIETLEKN